MRGYVDMERVVLVKEDEMVEIIKNVSIVKAILHDVSVDVSMNEKSRDKIDDAMETIDKVAELLK